MPLITAARLLIVALGAAVLLTPLPTLAQQAPRYREWTDKTGQYSTEAEFVRLSQGKVFLRSKSGRERSIDLAVLSEADRLYVAGRQREKVPAPAAPVVAPADDAPKSFAQVDRVADKMRSADQVVELMEWAADSLASDEDRAAAREALDIWRERSSQGLLRHGADWVPPHEIDARSAEEIRLLREAHRLMDVKNDRLALDRFRDASRINPEGVRADFYLGLLNALVSKHPINAARHFDECVDRLEENPDRLLGARRANLVAALNNLAIAEVRTMKFDRAIRHWQEAIELSPQTPELVQNLGLLTRMGGTGAGKYLSNRVGDKAGALYARATVANGSRDYDQRVGWLYMPYIDDIDGTLDDSGDNELLNIGWSTGIAVAPDLVLVTARATQGADRFRLGGGASLVGKIVSTDPNANLALVRFENLNATPMEWSAYEANPATPLTLQGFSQPGYGATGLRALPTTLQDARDLVPYELSCLAFCTSPTATSIARQTRLVGGGRMLEHSFVGDPGLYGGAICDARGIGYAVHLGPRAKWSRSDAKSSLALPASVVAAFVGRSAPAGVIDSEPPTPADIEPAPAGAGPDLSKTVFQVSALKFAPRLQWSHRIAEQHAAGGGGWASYEDRACMACNGMGRGECPNRDCKRGRVTKYKTVTTRGEGVFEGRTFTKQVPYKVTCPTCNGRGTIGCRACGSDGIR